MNKPLLTEIEEFLKETGMGHHRFGFKAARNSRLVERMREQTAKGRRLRVWPETEVAIRTFMASERLRRREDA